MYLYAISAYKISSYYCVKLISLLLNDFPATAYKKQLSFPARFLYMIFAEVLPNKLKTSSYGL